MILKKRTMDLFLEQHAQEAAFSWLLRNSAVSSSNHSLQSLGALDERIAANLAGLRLAGARAWKLCSRGLASQGAGELFVAAEIAVESDRSKRVESVLRAAVDAPERARAAVSALCWPDLQLVQPRLQGLLESPEAIRRQIGVAAAAGHRWDMGQQRWVAVLHDGDPRVRARALRAAGELGQTGILRSVSAATQDADGTGRFWAAWSAVLLGDRRPIGFLRDVAEVPGPLAARAADVAARAMELPQALHWLKKLDASGDPRLAVEVAGAIGDPSRVDWLVEQMSVPQLARVAAEAFSSITGADLSLDDLEGEKPAGFESGPTEDPEDEDVSMDPDEGLRWPDPALCATWWSENQSNRPSGRRHLAGKPVEPDWLHQVLRTGNQRQRAAAALELTLRQPGLPLFEVRAPAERQKAKLGL